jgi:hypothetical protein
MKNSSITTKEIPTVKEIADYFGKSVSWVYKNKDELGVRKLGGSLFFPEQEELYERLFCKEEEGVEIRLHPKRDSVHKNMVSDKKRSQKSRSRKEKRIEASHSQETIRNPDRHGLLRYCK